MNSDARLKSSKCRAKATAKCAKQSEMQARFASMEEKNDE